MEAEKRHVDIISIRLEVHAGGLEVAFVIRSFGPDHYTFAANMSYLSWFDHVCIGFWILHRSTPHD